MGPEVISSGELSGCSDGHNGAVTEVDPEEDIIPSSGTSWMIRDSRPMVV